jgi:hypothetical protein
MCSSVKLLTPIDELAHFRERPVDQIQVDDLQTEVRSRLVETRKGLVVAVVSARELAGDDYVGARHIRRPHGFAHLALVAVVQGRIE